MGWMGGLGKGLQGYAGILGEQRKLDWQTKQKDVQFERQKNLEMLRMQNQSKEAQIGRDFQAEQGLLNRNQRTLEAEASRGFQTKEREAGEQAKLDYLEEKDKYDKKHTLWLAEESSKLKASQREKEWTALKGNLERQGVPEEEMAEWELAAKNPDVYKMITEAKKKSGIQFKPEQYIQAQKVAATEWDGLSKEMKKKYEKTARDVDGDNVIDEEDVRISFLEARAMDISGYDKLLDKAEGGPQATATEPVTEPTGRMTDEMRDKAIANPRAITDEDINNATNKSDKRFLQSLKDNVPELGEVNVGSYGGLQGVPTGPEAEGENLGSMFWDKLKTRLGELRK